jgi:ABC-type branched-subunit amino acid transport system ATPase component
MGNLLVVDNVTKSFGGLSALAGISLVVRVGEILGLIGPNGSGKTTLFNCITDSTRSRAGGFCSERRPSSSGDSSRTRSQPTGSRGRSRRSVSSRI